MRRIIGTIAVVILGVMMAASMMGCNTIRGVGRDVQAGGRAIERAAEH